MAPSGITLLPIAVFSVGMLLQCTSLTLAADHGPQRAHDSDLSLTVLRLFQSKCITCHGPTIKSPKGKFDYVTNLQRVANNRDFVVQFKPNQSLLYIMLQDGDMPPDDSDISPITYDQIDLVRRWIEAGAMVSQQTVTAAAVQPTVPRKLKQTDSAFTHVRMWLGRFHPVSVHLPIGLIIAAALAELIQICSRQAELRIAARFCLTVGTIGAMLAATLGWWNGEAPVYAGKHDVWLTLHRWTGVATVVMSILATVLAQWDAHRPRQSTKIRYRTALFAAAVLVSVTGFLGGVNVYGIKHYQF